MSGSKRRNEWERFAKCIKEKRRKGNTSKSEKKTSAVGDTILSSKELTVQLLATEATGSSKKYQRLGPQEFVEFNGADVSIATLKTACDNHFKDRIPHNMSCEILASERGPSCTKMSHLKNLNVIHVRFVKSDNDQQDDQHMKNRSSNSQVCVNRSTSGEDSLPTVLKSVPVQKILLSKRVKLPVAAKSIGVSSMMRLAKPITEFEKLTETLQLSNFHLEKMLWSQPRNVKMEIEKEPFSSGGFRSAFKAKSVPRDGEIYVVKKYSEETTKSLTELKETCEAHARKSVQLHELASDFAEKLKIDLIDKNYNGEFFRYVKVGFGEALSTSEIVTIEKFIPGEFSKYVNNDGTINFEYQNDKRLMAETLCHYSYYKSEKKLMLLDIQGSNWDLYDPEIATDGSSFDDDELLFCMGNLSTEALRKFFKEHACNDICKMLNLQKHVL